MCDFVSDCHKDHLKSRAIFGVNVHDDMTTVKPKIVFMIAQFRLLVHDVLNTNWHDGVVVRVSASQSVDLWFIS